MTEIFISRHEGNLHVVMVNRAGDSESWIECTCGYKTDRYQCHKFSVKQQWEKYRDHWEEVTGSEKNLMTIRKNHKNPTPNHPKLFEDD